MRVVATAGHVDHGKSTLVRALTGTDPDRFPEERARGLTIDLGFAFTDLPSGTVVGFVDVPGHVRFVKNMLAGVGAVDVALLVVAANEGWMPQTAEHVAILRLLDVRHGLVALTKTGLVDEETADVAELELAEHLAGTPLARWPVVRVDAVTGAGIDTLRAVLDRVLEAAPPPRDDRRPRLWIDRAFSARGAGTVVTGTLTGGVLAVDDTVLVEPGGRPARIRGLESRHERVAAVSPGARVAVNLTGVDAASVGRGDALVRPGQWATPTTVDVALHALPGHRFPAQGSVHLHVGSGEHVAQLRILDADPTRDEPAAYARLRLPVGLPLAPGDRLVVRSSGRRATIGGAVVLDVAPARRAADARARLPQPLGHRVMAARPWLAPSELPALAGSDDVQGLLLDTGAAIELGSWLVDPAVVTTLRHECVTRVHAAAGAGVELTALAAATGADPARLRLVLDGEPRVAIVRELVRDASRATLADEPAARALVAALASQPFCPPAPAEVGASPALVRALVGDGTLVELGGIVFTAEAYAHARTIVTAALDRDGAVSVAEARDLLGSSRKYVLAILGGLDAEGVTRRRGDARVPGPRATAT